MKETMEHQEQEEILQTILNDFSLNLMKMVDEKIDSKLALIITKLDNLSESVEEFQVQLDDNYKSVNKLKESVKKLKWDVEKWKSKS